MKKTTSPRCPLLALFLLALFAPVVAEAGDGVDPRTPAIFPAAACLTVHDRSVDPIFTFGYTIPFEDTMLTEDEVADSRTHQFIGLCRGHHPQAPLPLWISEADVLDAASKGIVDPQIVEPSDILELADEWQGCWDRITPDKPRRPITHEAASQPVLWDTSGLPAGPHLIFGYTWHPYYNLWSPWRGVIKIIDGDADAAPPAIAVSNYDAILYPDQSVAIVGCVDAVDGATLTAYWSFTALDQIEWKPFAVDVPVDGAEFEIDFEPPPESVGGYVMIRVDVTDPMDRTATAYMTELITVLEGSADTGDTGDTSGTGGTGDSCGGSIIDVPECPTTTSGGTSDTQGGTSGATAEPTTAASDDTGSGGGCACAAGSRAPSGLALIGALLLLLRRRRS